MIAVADFEEEYLTSEMRRGKVTTPRWFRCPIHDTPEFQAVVHHRSEHGLALLGLWELIQRWCMRHWKRGGEFRMKTGEPMSLEQITHALGLTGQEGFVSAGIDVLKGVGWLMELGDAPPQAGRVVAPTRCSPIVSSPPTPKALPPSDQVESTERYATRSAVEEAWQALPSHKRRAKTRFAEAWIMHVTRTGEDSGMVIKSLVAYYADEEGQGKYARAAHTLVSDHVWEEDEAAWKRGGGDNRKPDALDAALVDERREDLI